MAKITSACTFPCHPGFTRYIHTVQYVGPYSGPRVEGRLLCERHGHAGSMCSMCIGPGPEQRLLLGWRFGCSAGECCCHDAALSFFAGEALHSAGSGCDQRSICLECMSLWICPTLNLFLNSFDSNLGCWYPNEVYE